MNSEYDFSLLGQLVGNGLFTVPQPRDFRTLTKVDTKDVTSVVPLRFRADDMNLTQFLTVTNNMYRL